MPINVIKEDTIPQYQKPLITYLSIYIYLALLYVDFLCIAADVTCEKCYEQYNGYSNMIQVPKY